MKHLLFVAVLLLAAGVASAQQLVKLTPYLSTMVVDSVVITADNDTVFFLNTDADSAVAGQYFYGPGIPYGTTIEEVVSADTVILSVVATATDTLATVQFTDFVDSTYAIGDVVGTPVQVPTHWKQINRIHVVDADDVQDSLYAYIVEGEIPIDIDNTAWSPADSVAADIIAYINLCTSVDVGASKIMYTNWNQPLVINRRVSTAWLYLVAGGAQNSAVQQPLTILLWGE